MVRRVNKRTRFLLWQVSTSKYCTARHSHWRLTTSVSLRAGWVRGKPISFFFGLYGRTSQPKRMATPRVTKYKKFIRYACLCLTKNREAPKEHFHCLEGVVTRVGVKGRVASPMSSRDCGYGISRGWDAWNNHALVGKERSINIIQTQHGPVYILLFVTTNKVDVLSWTTRQKRMYLDPNSCFIPLHKLHYCAARITTPYTTEHVEN